MTASDASGPLHPLAWTWFRLVCAVIGHAVQTYPVHNSDAVIDVCLRCETILRRDVGRPVPDARDAGEGAP